MTPRRSALVLLGGFAGLVGVWSLLGLLLHQVGGDAVLRAVDRPLLDGLHSLRSPGLDSFMLMATHLGHNLFVATALTLAAVVALRWSDRLWPTFFAMCLLGALLLHPLVKLVVGRPRPQIDPLIDIGGLSFPSGHATASAVLFVALAYAASRASLPWTTGMQALCVVAVVLVAATRVYLGVHWPTDVAAGAVLGSAWVAVAAVGSGVARNGRDSSRVILPRTGRRGRVA